MAIIDVMISTVNHKSTVQAILAAPGLAVHQDVFQCAMKEHTWTITHVESGWAVAKGLPDRKYAKMLAKKLAKIINWEKFKGESEVGKMPRSKYNRIIALLDMYAR